MVVRCFIRQMFTTQQIVQGIGMVTYYDNKWQSIIPKDIQKSSYYNKQKPQYHYTMKRIVTIHTFKSCQNPRNIKYKIHKKGIVTRIKSIQLRPDNWQNVYTKSVKMGYLLPLIKLLVIEKGSWKSSKNQTNANLEYGSIGGLFRLLWFGGVLFNEPCGVANLFHSRSSWFRGTWTK